MNTKPSICRIVIYTENTEQYAAMITKVEDEEKQIVSLEVHYPQGDNQKIHGIEFNAEFAEGKWSWPPRV